MRLEFRKPNASDIKELEAFKREFQEDGSVMDGTNTLARSTPEEWLAYAAKREKRDEPSHLPCLYYGLYRQDGDDCRLLGIIQIRLALNDYLREFGGHIGYCVRPSERRKGYAKAMLREALEICRAEGIREVMISCLTDNIGSAKTIEGCGGKFEKTVYDATLYKAALKRYWIFL